MKQEQIRKIEHLWKQATNCPHHDTNWFDPSVVKFAELLMANNSPQSFMTWQEGYEAGKQAERARLQAFMRQMIDAYALPSTSVGLRGKPNQE